MNGGCSEEGVGGLPAAAAPAPQPPLISTSSPTQSGSSSRFWRSNMQPRCGTELYGRVWHSAAIGELLVRAIGERVPHPSVNGVKGV